MTNANNIGGAVIKDATKIGDTIYLSVPMKTGDKLIINGWEITLPESKASCDYCDCAFSPEDKKQCSCTCHERETN